MDLTEKVLKLVPNKETLFNKQELLKLVITSFILGS